MKSETKVKLFYVGTLGFGYIYAKNKAKKQVHSEAKSITVSKEIDFQIADLVKALGGKQNITNVTSTISNLKVKLNDISKVNVNLIKSLGAKGTSKGSDSITILFGDNSSYIASLLNKTIAK